MMTFFPRKMRANFEHFGRTADFCAGDRSGALAFLRYRIEVFLRSVWHTCDNEHSKALARARWLMPCWWLTRLFSRLMLVRLNLTAIRPLPIFLFAGSWCVKRARISYKVDLAAPSFIKCVTTSDFVDSGFNFLNEYTRFRRISCLLSVFLPF